MISQLRIALIHLHCDRREQVLPVILTGAYARGVVADRAIWEGFPHQDVLQMGQNTQKAHLLATSFASRHCGLQACVDHLEEGNLRITG